MLPFSKYHGLANDFILLDSRATRTRPTSSSSIRLCDRRRSIGADGVITLLPPRDPRARLRMHIFNSDGSQAEMCGNGLRCVVKWILRGSPGDRLVVDTDAGLRTGWLLDDGRVRETMGSASLLHARVEAKALNETRRGIGISMGNPHLVLEPWPEGTDLLELARALGPTLERHAMFPEGANVGFLAPKKDGLRLVVFERGAGITQACGTGAAAAAVAARRFGLTASERVSVELLGGLLDVFIAGDPTRGDAPGAALGEVEIAGPAEHAFDGTVAIEAHELEIV